jgi:lysine-specific permease
MLAQGKSLEELPYIAKGHPYMNIIAMVACIVICLISGWSYFVPADPIGLVGCYGGLIIFFGAYLILKVWTKEKLVPYEMMDLETDVRHYTEEEILKDQENSKGFLKKFINIFT